MEIDYLKSSFKHREVWRMLSEIVWTHTDGIDTDGMRDDFLDDMKPEPTLENPAWNEPEYAKKIFRFLPRPHEVEENAAFKVPSAKEFVKPEFTRERRKRHQFNIGDKVRLTSLPEHEDASTGATRSTITGIEQSLKEVLEEIRKGHVERQDFEGLWMAPCKGHERGIRIRHELNKHRTQDVPSKVVRRPDDDGRKLTYLEDAAYVGRDQASTSVYATAIAQNFGGRDVRVTFATFL